MKSCKNCTTQFQEQFDFCPACGARYIDFRITPKNLWEDFADRFLNLENSFLKTFFAMFTKPEDVIGSYINGTRKRYLTAFSYFAIAITLQGLYVFFTKDQAKGDINEIQKMFGYSKAQAEATLQFTEVFFDYNTLVIYFLVPLLALISYIVFFNKKKYNYVEHLVLYLFSYSHTALISAIVFSAAVMIGGYAVMMWVSLLFSLLTIVYHAYVLKRIFNLNGVQLTLKTLYFFLIGGVFYFIMILAVAMVMAYLGMFDEMIETARQQAEAAKAAQGN